MCSTPVSSVKKAFENRLCSLLADSSMLSFSCYTLFLVRGMNPVKCLKMLNLDIILYLSLLIFVLTRS